MIEIPGFRIVNKIGKGGMGEVYLAEDIGLGRWVAIKILSLKLASDEHFLSRFKSEARIQAALSHSNIVTLYHFAQQDDYYYMILEYAVGKTLKNVLKQEGMLEEKRAVKIIRQALSGLGYAHEKNVIHRDLKPENIIIDEHDNVKIMDFGVAKLIGDTRLTKSGVNVGTVYYMSPEQINAEKNIDGRSDIYSIGILFYELLTNSLPFNTNEKSEFQVMSEIVHGQISDPRFIRKDISESVAATVMKMIEKDRGHRFPSCKVCIDALDGWVDSRRKTAEIKPPSKRFEVLTVSKKQSGVRRVSLHGLNQNGQPQRIKDDLRSESDVPISEEYVFVKGGSFIMGKNTMLASDEKPEHTVDLRDFFISKFLVTQAEYFSVIGKNPSYTAAEDHPVDSVSWYDAIVFCNKKSEAEHLRPVYKIEKNIIDENNKGLSDKLRWIVEIDYRATGYRLPTEAEWEYAVRGGQLSKSYEYSGSNFPDTVAWYNKNTDKNSRPIAQKAPNELGLFDMSGNVWEWCFDWYAQHYYAACPIEMPAGPHLGKSRVARGGSYFTSEKSCRNTARNGAVPDSVNQDFGFRLVRMK